MSLIVGVPKETCPGERRVALVPRAIDVLAKTGATFIVESGAGVASGVLDKDYEAKGIRVASRQEVFAQADVILQVRTLGANPESGKADLDLITAKHTLIGLSEPLTAKTEAQALASKGATVFALELVPRITRAQSMDVLSSMATIAGYRAVLIAAEALPKMFPMLMTAAGTVPPAKVFVLGVGVAGLQAIATAKRLGAVVSAYDVRPAVKEQAESVGAKFVTLALDTGAAETKGGYAKELGEEFYKKQRELLTEVIREQDVLITTAAVPGRKAPILVTTEMARAMAPGSVIVDLAAERGGNCELTKAGETVIDNEVRILGPLNIPSGTAVNASQMFARNTVTLLKLLIEKGLTQNHTGLDMEDEIIRETLWVHEGKVVHGS
jgi:H+-translocating NAD(P) transhydrogenase subunit alpha